MYYYFPHSIVVEMEAHTREVTHPKSPQILVSHKDCYLNPGCYFESLHYVGFLEKELCLSQLYVQKTGQHKEMSPGLGARGVTVFSLFIYPQSRGLS